MRALKKSSTSIEGTSAHAEGIASDKGGARLSIGTFNPLETPKIQIKAKFSDETSSASNNSNEGEDGARYVRIGSYSEVEPDKTSPTLSAIVPSVVDSTLKLVKETKALEEQLAQTEYALQQLQSSRRTQGPAPSSYAGEASQQDLLAVPLAC